MQDCLAPTDTTKVRKLASPCPVCGGRQSAWTPMRLVRQNSQPARFPTAVGAYGSNPAAVLRSPPLRPFPPAPLPVDWPAYRPMSPSLLDLDLSNRVFRSLTLLCWEITNFRYAAVRRCRRAVTSDDTSPGFEERRHRFAQTGISTRISRAGLGETDRNE